MDGKKKLLQRDNHKKTGCYNLQCSGFVQIHGEQYIGAIVPRTSVGGTIIEYTFSISQDPKTKNWWLNIGGKDDKRINIGYYPAKLFSNMGSADQVGWGGRTVTLSGTPSPEMGSGYFPDPNIGRACYFRMVSFQNEKRTDLGPEKEMVSKFVDRSQCFNAEYFGLGKNKILGYYLEFGGPGGNCGD
ncbi:hypothetical protein LR48_Vigan07g075900 [Vigna angularis]|uniref:Neprosin PEP catalytic domain-containing protein n=1 Tax=Phaseolus angularis TaxID=3914 RepID=A0A0L9UW29_PHAAN|nr:hypothetical protein LR48_Vigan07g075900 [Vigna angularis]